MILVQMISRAWKRQASASLVFPGTITVRCSLTKIKTPTGKSLCKYIVLQGVTTFVLRVHNVCKCVDCSGHACMDQLLCLCMHASILNLTQLQI